MIFVPPPKSSASSPLKVKINPLLYFRGELPVYFEHAISQRVSMEIAVGITLRNYLNLTLNTYRKK